MYFPRKQITQPEVEPINRSDVKLQTYKTESETDQDPLIDSMIIAARIQLENDTSRQLVQCKWDAYPPGFTGAWNHPDFCKYNELPIPLGNLISIDSFAYTDTAGTTTNWTVSGNDLLLNGVVQAHIDTISEPAKIVLAYGQSWPSVVLKTSNPIAIRFTCGYADAAAVPEALKHALRMLVAHFYENRETTSVGTLMQSGETLYGYRQLIASYKLHAF